MKTIAQLKKQKPVFLNNWSDSKSVFNDFSNYRYGNIKEDYIKEGLKSENEKYKGVKIIFASYGTGGYEGNAFVLFIKGNKLFEVNGSHCSCYGLENQWDPEPTTIKFLAEMLTKGKLGLNSYCGNSFRDELCKFLGVKIPKEETIN